MLRRSPLARRTSLKRSSLRRQPRLQSAKPSVTPAEREWKRPRWGRCENCGVIDSQALQGHHVIARLLLRRAGPEFEFDPRVRMDLCESCHMNHTFGQTNRKIAVEKIPERALAFAVDVLGEALTADHVRRHYNCSETL